MGEPTPAFVVKAKNAPDITGTLERMQEQIDALTAQLAAKADGTHTHTFDGLDGTAELRGMIADLGDRLEAAEAAVEQRPTGEAVAKSLAGKADREHRHTLDDVDDDGRYATVTDGRVDRAVLPPITEGDLPAHGHRARDISGLGSAATYEAHTIEELARRVAALESRGS